MIVRLNALSGAERDQALAALERIFFAGSLRQSFPDAAARAAFFAVWTGWYINQAPQDVYLWRASPAAEKDAAEKDAAGKQGGERNEGAWAGYLTGCRDSAGAAGLFQTIPLYDRFADQFATFPAHLHVNIDDAHRNRGIGAALIDAFAADCRTGLHVVTGAAARNRSFYRRCGFATEIDRGGLLFMGRSPVADAA